MIDFKLYYEYINDADMARAEKFERDCRAEKSRVKKFQEQMLILFILCTARRRRVKSN